MTHTLTFIPSWRLCEREKMLFFPNDAYQPNTMFTIYTNSRHVRKQQRFIICICGTLSTQMENPKKKSNASEEVYSGMIKIELKSVEEREK